MRTAVRSGGSAALLLALLGAAWAAGAALHPVFPGAVDGRAPGAAAPGVAAPDVPAPGWATADPTGGYTLVPHTTQLDPGRPGEFAFTLRGTAALAALAAPPRLTVVRRDATHLVHAVPTADADGTWHAALTLPSAGEYRVVVEVAPAVGPPGVLTADLVAPGPFDAVPLTPSRVAEVDGYQVRIDGDLVPGAPAQVFATVSREGAPVTDLEPVDGGFGSLAALRVDDLAPARVHPDAATPAPADRAGPGIAFTAEVPAAGTYRLFLEFRHGGAPHTAVFTVATGSTG
jgi:hypothetical protein